MGSSVSPTPPEPHNYRFEGKGAYTVPASYYDKQDNVRNWPAAHEEMNADSMRRQREAFEAVYGKPLSDEQEKRLAEYEGLAHAPHPEYIKQEARDNEAMIEWGRNGRTRGNSSSTVILCLTIAALLGLALYATYELVL